MTILITRPQPQAAHTASMLHKSGFETIISPALILHSTILSADEQQLLHNATAIIITSQSALRILHTHGIARDVTLYVTGSILADIARAHGFMHVQQGNGDVTSLLDYIQRHASTHNPLLYMRGQRITHDVAAVLRKATYDVQELVAYKAKEANALNPEAIAALQQRHITHALFYSTFSAQSFLVLCHMAGCEALLQHVTAAAISDNVAAALRKTTWRNVVTSDSPQHQDIIRVLRDTT